MEHHPTVIAVCGKGGVGKTSISALTVRQLLRDGEKRVLAIDADPAVGLATALGVDVAKTVDDIRLEVIEKSRKGQRTDREELLAMLDYAFMDAMVDENGFAFLAIGRPESEGCYCKVNEFLKLIIESLVGKFDYVVIDGEAGIEQINRRVLEKVTHLLLVSDCSKKGLNVIGTIADVARGSMACDRTGVIVNKLKTPEEREELALGGLELLGVLPEDEQLRRFDIEGKSLLTFEENRTTGLLAEALERFGVRKHELRCEA